PVPCPFFTVMRRSEQPVDQPFVCIRTAVCQEISNFLWTRGNADEIQIQPPHECAPVSLRGRSNAFGFQARQNERIDRIADPVTLANGRSFRPANRLESPVLGVATRLRRINRSFRPRGTLIDPGAQDLNLPGIETGTSWRH